MTRRGSTVLTLPEEEEEEEEEEGGEKDSNFQDLCLLE